jgi:hypothetical protein
MNISELTSNLVNLLIEDGKLDKETVDKLVINHPNHLLIAATDLVHSLICQAKHNQDCSYYDERELENSEVIKTWTKFTLQLSEWCEMEDIREFTKANIFISSIQSKLYKASPAELKLFNLWYTRNQIIEFLPATLSFPSGPVMIEELPEA